MRVKKLHTDWPEPSPQADDFRGRIAENDQGLWDKFKEGDEVAFITIYKEHFSSLYRYASQFSSDKSFIQDCIQDLFVEIREKRGRLSSTTSIKAYLFKSLKNLVLYRIKRYKKLFEPYRASNHGFRCSLSAEDLHIQWHQEKETSQKLNRCIEQLSERQKEAIYYYYFENFTYSQVKDIMGMYHVRSARNLIYRALIALRKQLQTEKK